MECYEYKVVKLKFSIWKQKPDGDYLEILNELGGQGWRFIDFAPRHVVPKETKHDIEMIFERKIIDTKHE